MNPAELLELPLQAPSHRNPESREAARSVSPAHTAELRRRIWVLLIASMHNTTFPGQTADQAAAALGKDSHSIAPRFVELRRLGLIFAACEPDGRTRLRRRTRSGRRAQVYFPVQGEPIP